jgi:hypothetical protein
METVKGRPVITKEDDPRTIYDALRVSIRYGNSGQLPTDGRVWIKQAQDASEALGDGFMLHYGLDEVESSDAHVTLYMSPDQLEYALVCHGLEQLDRGESVQAVDAALLAVDAIKTTR